jgi:hypothetical protein
MHYLIVIAVAGKPKAVDRLIDRIDALVEGATMEGGIDGLTTEVVTGAAADTTREYIRAAAAKTARKGNKG